MLVVRRPSRRPGRRSGRPASDERWPASPAAPDGGEKAAVPAANSPQAAKLLKQSILKVLVFNRDYRGPRHAGEARLFAAAGAALGCASCR